MVGDSYHPVEDHNEWKSLGLCFLITRPGVSACGEQGSHCISLAPGSCKCCNPEIREDDFFTPSHLQDPFPPSREE